MYIHHHHHLFDVRFQRIICFTLVEKHDVNSNEHSFKQQLVCLLVQIPPVIHRQSHYRT
jgi:hypothetical protein